MTERGPRSRRERQRLAADGGVRNGQWRTMAEIKQVPTLMRKKVSCGSILFFTMAGDASPRPAANLSADALASALASLALTPGSRVVVRTRTTIEVRSPRAIPTDTATRAVHRSDQPSRGDDHPKATSRPALQTGSRPYGAQPWTLRDPSHYGQTRYAAAVQTG
jgi:hypothetical protein